MWIVISKLCFKAIVLYCIVYLYSVKYIHVQQDSNHYLTHLTLQEQAILPQLEDRLKDDNLSTSLRLLKHV